MAIKFDDFDTEKTVIAACLKGPEYWKNVPDAWFHTDISRKVYKELKTFLEPPYQTYPSADIVFEKSEDLDVKLFVKEISTIKIEHRDINVKLYDLFEMYAARKVYDIAQSVPNDLEKSRVEEVVRARMKDLAELVNPFEVGQRKRGFIYESAAARWQRYREIEDDPKKLNKIPFGITELDKYTNGGTRPGHITLFFAKSGGFKTKVKANISYNMAFESCKDVAVITLEVPKEDYEAIIDSRHALIDFNNITSSTLDDMDRDKYRNALIDIDERKPSLYIADIPGDATSADIIGEAELYYVQNSKYPDVVVLDYINEMDPLKPWGTNTGTKFKNLGVEIRKATRSYKFAFIGSMQENRKATDVKENKKKVDLEHIGESHSFHNVCHLVVHLYQDETGIDEASNSLHWGIKKSRYGPNHVSFTTFINPAVNYVGDRNLIIDG